MLDTVLIEINTFLSRGFKMEYGIAAGGIGISDILQKISANPWLIAAIAAVVIVVYFVTTRA